MTNQRHDPMVSLFDWFLANQKINGFVFRKGMFSSMRSYPMRLPMKGSRFESSRLGKRNADKNIKKMSI
ncbi:MAG TPA: hypothetical protein VJ346_09505 [Bacteroidales bacterium]|nr:hypothetical protein [Bacteroidales bacterium]